MALPLDIFPKLATRAAVGSMPTTVPKSLDPSTLPQENGRPLNPKAVKALRQLSEMPEFATSISTENQEKVKRILSGIGPDNKFYKYGAQSGPGDIGVMPWLNKKLNPFVPDEQFAPGQQSIYGDVATRYGAGTRNAMQTYGEHAKTIQPELEKLDEEYKATPDYPGKAYEYQLKKRELRKTDLGLAWQEGVLYPQTVERFQDATINKYYDRPETQGAMAQGGMPAAGAVLGGYGASAVGLARDIFTNPFDIATMALPIPKPLQALGDVRLGGGFVKNAKTALFPGRYRPASAGVRAAEDAIKANLNRPVVAGEQLEFPFGNNPVPEKPAVEGAGGQFNFPFLKPEEPRVTTSPNQLEFPFTDVGNAPGSIARDASGNPIQINAGGQKTLRFMKKDTGEGIVSPTIKEVPQPAGLPKADVRPQFTTGQESPLLDYLNNHFTGYEIVRMSPAERVRLGNMSPAQLRDEITVMKNVKLNKPKVEQPATTPLGAKIQEQVIKGEEVPLHPASEGRAAEAARQMDTSERAASALAEGIEKSGTTISPELPKPVAPTKEPLGLEDILRTQREEAVRGQSMTERLKGKSGQARFDTWSDEELERRLNGAISAGNKVLIDTYTQAKANRGKPNPLRVKKLGKSTRNVIEESSVARATPKEPTGIQDIIPAKTPEELETSLKNLKYERLSEVQEQKVRSLISDFDDVYSGKAVYDPKTKEYIDYNDTQYRLGDKYTQEGIRATGGGEHFQVYADARAALDSKAALTKFDNPVKISTKGGYDKTGNYTTPEYTIRYDPDKHLRNTEILSNEDHFNHIYDSAKAIAKSLEDETKSALVNIPELGFKGKLNDFINPGESFQKTKAAGPLKKAVKKLKDKTGTARLSSDSDDAADDVVKAFRNVLPSIIDDVKKNGGTVMERIKSMTDDAGKPLANDAVLKMIEKEVSNYASAAKAEVTRHGNWNLKNINAKLRQSVIEMAERDKNLTKKGATISDAKVKEIAAGLTDTPTVRAILKGKPGELAGEVRKQVDDAVSSLRAVIEDDLGPVGLHKKLMEVVKERFKQQKEVSSRVGRALRQNQLTADDSVEIKRIIQEAIQKYKDDPLMHPDDYATMRQGLIKMQNDLLDTSNITEFMDKAYYTWLNGLLSNPFTHGVNLISNAAFLLEKLPNRFFDVLGDATVRMLARTQGIRMDPAYRLKEIPAMFRGFSRFAQRKIQGRKMPFRIKKGTKLDIDLPTPLSKSWERIIGLPVRLLKKGDEFFKEAVGYMEYYARHVAGERGDTLHNAIYEEQLIRTFQDPASALGKGIMNLKNTVPGLRYIIPFINTPDRILFRSLERTLPGAIAKAGIKIKQGASQKEIAHALGLVYQSALLTYGIAHLWSKGLIQGDAPTDEAERTAFYESGKKANAIKVGSWWVPFNRVEPIGGAMSITTNFIQDVANSKQEATLDKIVEGIGGTTQSLLNKTYYQGILGLMRASTEAHIYGGKWVNKMASSAVPASGLQRFFAQLTDPVYRNPDTIAEQIMTGIPGLSKNVPPTLGSFGDVQKRDILSIGKEKEDALTKALKETPVPVPGRMVAGEKITTREYNDILIKSGPILKNTLTVLTSSPMWKTLPKGIRSEVVNDVSEQIRGVFRSELKMKKISEQIKANPDAYIQKFLD